MFGLTKFLSLFVAAAAAQQCAMAPQASIKVAEPVKFDLTYDGSAPLTTSIYNPANTFVAVHFASLNVPKGGKLTLTSFDGADSVSFEGGVTKTNFFADWLTAGKGGVKITYDGPYFKTEADGPYFTPAGYDGPYFKPANADGPYFKPESDGPYFTPAGADGPYFTKAGADGPYFKPEADGPYFKPQPIFTIDKFMAGKQGPIPESLCGDDKSKPAPCYAVSEPGKTKAGKAVARLFIGGQYLCTGWLVGSEGHLLTNHHCIESADGAKDVQVELGAECKTCEDPNNQKQLACKGEIVATDAVFVTTDVKADFTLVKLNLKANVDLTKYGYLQMRPDGPKLNEEIAILGHAAGWPKRFAVVAQDGKPGLVTNASIPSCQADEFGYVLDTQGGNSGSPVISTKDNSVIGIHNCGGCPDGPNGGIKINKVVDILKTINALPKDSIAGDKPAC